MNKIKLRNAYCQQVELLLQVLPIINRYDCFALKGGTAINLFIRDMPRLSVDVDLTYIPVEPRSIFLDNIRQQLSSLSQDIQRTIDDSVIHYTYTRKDEKLAKIVVERKGVEVKIEPSLIFRGCVFSCIEKKACSNVYEQFFLSPRMKIMSFEDIYAGKICAALNRQHPRDLFDVGLLFENEGITEKLKKAVVVYLASDARPIYELLNPHFIDFSLFFNEDFKNMVFCPIGYDELLEVRSRLIKEIKNVLDEKDRLFLYSIKLGEPKWNLIDIEHVEHLPSIQWKLLNVRKMDRQKHKIALSKLRAVLEL